MSRNITEYDKIDEYNRKLRPMVKKLMEEANKLQIPVFFTAAVSNSQEGTNYVSNAVLAATDYSLMENRIANILFLMNGFLDDAPADIKEKVRELVTYLKPAVPDVENILEIKLKDDKITSIYKASQRKIELCFPEGTNEKAFDESLISEDELM